MPDAAPEPHASLWDELRALLRIAAQVFGAPRDLLEDLVLPRAEARRLAGWIASLEAVARALLSALAATLPAPEPRAPGGAGAGRKTAIRPAADDMRDGDAPPPEVPDSERWAGVVFRVAPRARSGGPSGPSAPRRFLQVRGLAFRLEALIRVAAAPEPYARRLARRLRAEPALMARVLRWPKGRRGTPPPYDELVAEAFSVARSAAHRPGTG